MDMEHRPNQQDLPSGSGGPSYGRRWAVAALVLVGALASGGWWVNTKFNYIGGLKKSKPYHMAREQVCADHRVRELLGEPVTAGWWVTGWVASDAQSGEARITFPVTGPLGKAQVSATGIRREGRWGLQDLRVQFAQGAPLSLDAAGSSELEEAPRFEQTVGRRPTAPDAPPVLEFKIPQ
jgi:hypothetical protein